MLAPHTASGHLQRDITHGWLLLWSHCSGQPGMDGQQHHRWSWITPLPSPQQQHPALCCHHRPQQREENAELGVCRKTSEHLSGALSIHRGEDTNTCSKPAPEPATLIYETEKLHSVAARGTQAPVLAGHLTVSAAFYRSEMAFVTRDQVLGAMQPTTTTSHPELHFYNILLHGTENCDCSPKSEQQYLLCDNGRNTTNSLIY